MKFFKTFRNSWCGLCFLWVCASAQDKPNITLYKNNDPLASLEFNECVSNIHVQLSSYINTHGNCVTLYRDSNCSEDFVVVQKDNHKKQYLSDMYRWEPSPDSSEVTTYTSTRSRNNSMKSIGPCLAKCDLRNIERKAKEPVTVVVVDSIYSLASINATLSVNGCTPFPTKLKRRVAVHSFPNLEHVCLEYHKQSDCMGEYQQVRLRHFHMYSMRYILGNEFVGNNDAVAISLCGYQCNTTGKYVVPPKPEEPELPLDYVRIYDDANFMGYSKDINISEDCVDLTGDWMGQLVSIKNNGLCVTLFDDFGCKANSTSTKSVMIGSTENNYCLSKFSKDIRDSPSEIKSLAKCSQNTWNLRHMIDQLEQSPNSSETSSTSFLLVMFLILMALTLVSLGVAHIVLYMTRMASHNNNSANVSASNMNLYGGENYDAVL